jgi:hypothetical protein
MCQQGRASGCKPFRLEILRLYRPGSGTLGREVYRHALARDFKLVKRGNALRKYTHTWNLDAARDTNGFQHSIGQENIHRLCSCLLLEVARLQSSSTSKLCRCEMLILSMIFP